MSKQKKADMLLILVSFFWGASYYLTTLARTELPAMTLTAYRFISGFLVLGIVFFKQLRTLNRPTLRYSILIGLSLTGTYIFYAYGLPMTSISNAAFICALPVVFTPLFGFLFCRTPLRRKTLTAIIFCTIGLALMTLSDNLRLNLGDLICMGTPACYAVDLLLTEKAVRDPRVDPLVLGVMELSVVAVITTVMALVMEKPCLPASGAVWGATLFLGLLGTGVAFVIQSVKQKYTSASHVGLIFTLEPVFASIVAFFLTDERLTARGYIGAVIMLLSLLLMEIEIPLQKKNAP